MLNPSLLGIPVGGTKPLGVIANLADGHGDFCEAEFKGRLNN